MRIWFYCVCMQKSCISQFAKPTSFMVGLEVTIWLKLSATNHALKSYIGSRPFRYRKKNAQSKKAITAPHPSFILYPTKIIAITANITRIIREMNSKEKAGSSPIPNNPIYSKNIITSAFLFV